jgi:hypothetical protein
MIINRDLLKIKLTSEKVPVEDLQPLKERFASENNINIAETNFFIFKGKIKNQAYSKVQEPIRILKKDRTVEDVIESSDQLNLKSLSKSVTKYYICFPKQLVEMNI